MNPLSAVEMNPPQHRLAHNTHVHKQDIIARHTGHKDDKKHVLNAPLKSPSQENYGVGNNDDKKWRHAHVSKTDSDNGVKYLKVADLLKHK